MPSTPPCPCGSGDSYAACCRPRHEGDSPAPTAEALMRSRYSAFALGDDGYVRRTWHPSTRPADLELDGRLQWTGLDVAESVDGGPDDATGTVEFRAHYRSPQVEDGVLHERSSFARRAGRWVYVDGEIR